MMRSFLIAVLSCLIFFAVFELASDFWLDKYGNALDKSRKILQVDKHLGWRQMANLNTKFLGLPLVTNELGWRSESIDSLRQNTKKILVLGPSSTFGWGVRQEDTYSTQLEALLAASGSVRVINAGEIGYSTEQGVRLFSRADVLAIKPDVVVIAYGVNDLDRYRFYFQSTKADVEELSNQRPTVSYKFLNFAYSSSFVNLLLKSISWVNLSLIKPDYSSSLTSLRVGPDDFKKNLIALVGEVQSRNASVILLTTATNLTEEKNLENSSLKVDEKQEVERIKRGIEVYNIIVRNVASEKGVLAGDLNEWMKGSERGELFVDPIHFSKLGNSLIASGLRDIILQNKLLEKDGNGKN